MPNWIQRVGAMFGSRPAAPALVTPPSHTKSPPTRARPTPAQAPAAESSIFAESVMPDTQGLFFEWLLGVGPTLAAPLRPAETRLLAQLDAMLAADAPRADLLPRAPAVIPRLMSSLRDDSQSAQALAAGVAKDPHLVAEVVRLANSTLACGGEPVGDLSQAVGRLGTGGLRRAIARVVLKPIFDAQPDSLSGRAAPRLWQHADAKAAACMRLAAVAGLDPFEGYLAGLMHNIGWAAALRALDRANGSAPPQFSRAFVEALAPRRESFFALLVIPWQLTDSLTALAVELRDGGLASTTSPLGQALLAADRYAALDMLGAGTLLETTEVAPLRS